MLNTFLQVTVTEAMPEVNMIDMIMQGGWTMVPLFILSIVAIYIFIERFITLNKASQNSRNFMSQISEKVKSQDVAGAMALCENEHSPIGKMIGKGLKRLGSPLKTIEEAVENVGKIEVDRLEKNLSTLATISGAAPMLGFLGTVLGMIKTFLVIAYAGSAKIGDMAGGISEAMVTTATGLIVGIIAYIAYNFLSAKLQKVIHTLELSSIEFLDLLHEPQKVK